MNIYIYKYIIFTYSRWWQLLSCRSNEYIHLPPQFILKNLNWLLVFWMWTQIACHFVSIWFLYAFEYIYISLVKLWHNIFQHTTYTVLWTKIYLLRKRNNVNTRFVQKSFWPRNTLPMFTVLKEILIGFRRRYVSSVINLQFLWSTEKLEKLFTHSQMNQTEESEEKEHTGKNMSHFLLRNYFMILL